MAAPPVTSKSVSLSSSKVLFRFLLPVSLLVLYSYLAFHHRSLSEGLFFASTSKLSQAPLYQSIKAGPLSAVIGKPTFQLFENWSQKILTTTVVLPQTQTLVLFVVLYLLYGFCYTAGYHRLWAHQSFSANFILRLVFAFGGAGNFNGTILNWSRNHRAHHRHIDCEQVSGHKKIIN